jgi:hypothetical protein
LLLVLLPPLLQASSASERLMDALNLIAAAPAPAAGQQRE